MRTAIFNHSPIDGFRKVGPSGMDSTAVAQLPDYPSLVYDYIGIYDSELNRNAIHHWPWEEDDRFPRHPMNDPAKIYHLGPVRRTTSY